MGAETDPEVSEDSDGSREVSQDGTPNSQIIHSHAKEICRCADWMPSLQVHGEEVWEMMMNPIFVGSLFRRILQ